MSLLSFMKFGLCVLGYRQGGPAGLRPDGWRTVKLCHVAPGCCRCWCWWWWRDAKLGLNIHNNSTGARTRCCGAVVLRCWTPPHPFMCVVLSALLPPLYSYHTSTSFQRDEFFDKAGITSQHKHIHNTINTDNNVHIILQSWSKPFCTS